MVKYKYLGLKYLIPSVLLILLIVYSGIFVFGGPKKEKNVKAFEGNTEWLLDEDGNPCGFTDYHGKQKEDLIANKLIADNDNYALVINEDTTIVSLYRKKEGWDKENPTEKATYLYGSAQTTGTDTEKSNLQLEYFNEDGKTSILDAYSKSVSYYNITTGESERYYEMRYGTDFVDVLYHVGNFNPTIIPKKYDMRDFGEMFIGNTVFFFEQETAITEYTPIYDEEDPEKEATDPDTGEPLKGEEWKHQDILMCFDTDAAIWILRKIKGSKMSYYTTAPVSKEYTAESLEKEEAEIRMQPGKQTGGYWRISGILDEKGRLQLVPGKDYNTEADENGNLLSPVIINPFTNDVLLTEIFSIYEVNDITGVNKEGNPITISTKWFCPNPDPKIQIVATRTGAGLSQTTLYRHLYAQFRGKEPILDESGAPLQDKDGNPIYTYNYDPQQYILHRLKLDSEDKGKPTGPTPAYYDYNQDGKITSDEKYLFGGYQKRDQNGGFLYDKDGRPVPMGLQTEEAEAQNEKFKEETSGKAAFDICLRFALTEEGMDVTVINESIREGIGKGKEFKASHSYLRDYLAHNNKIFKIIPCRFLAVNQNKKSTGEIILPDGSGAVIRFNSPKVKQHMSKYPEKRIYGDDIAINRQEAKYSSENLMFPLFGFLEQSDKKGIVGIVSEGAAQTTVSADYSRSDEGLNKYNYVFFSVYYRDFEKVKITSTSEYTKISNKFYPGDVTFKYIALDEDKLSYVGVAEKYRKYLIDKYDLDEKGDTTTYSVPTISFVGAYKKKTYKMGIVYNGNYSLTSFREAKEIIDELTDNDVRGMNVVYISWTEDGIFEEITDDIKVSRKTGGRKELKKTAHYLKEKNIDFFPDYKIVKGKGINYRFGKMKYNSESVSGSYSIIPEYSQGTKKENKQLKKNNIISPLFYSAVSRKYLKNYKKLGLSGICLSDLGNQIASDYNRRHQVFSDEATFYQREALRIFNEEGEMKLMLRKPYDYSFDYIGVATDIPFESSNYPSVDYSIPLYQLIVSGLFDYSMSPGNYRNYSQSGEKYLLKAIETGSNLSFLLSARDTKELTETDYSQFFNAYYINQKEKIIDMNRILDDTGIYESRLVSHRYLKDKVAEVKYENGLTIIVNLDKENYTDEINGLTVRAEWFAIIEPGEAKKA